MYTSIARSPQSRAASTGRAPRPSVPAILMYTLAGKQQRHDGGPSREIGGPHDDDDDDDDEDDVNTRAAIPGQKLHFVNSSVPGPGPRGPVPP